MKLRLLVLSTILVLNSRVIASDAGYESDGTGPIRGLAAIAAAKQGLGIHECHLDALGAKEFKAAALLGYKREVLEMDKFGVHETGVAREAKKTALSKAYKYGQNARAAEEAVARAKKAEEACKIAIAEAAQKAAEEARVAAARAASWNPLVRFGYQAPK